MKKTPIRLVALEEDPPQDDDQDITIVQDFAHAEDTAPTQDATPVRSTPEHEAITRRVPVVPQVAPAWLKQRRSRWGFIFVGAAVLSLAAVVLTRSTNKPAPVPVARTAASASSAGEKPQVSPVRVSQPPSESSQAKAAPEVIRLQITAEPMDAELSLDGNVLAGHRLNLEVPRDRGIHVVSASAPGHFPFNQQVSFSEDVVLHINLRRVHGPGMRQTSHQHPSHAEVKPEGSRPPPIQQVPRLEPGMDLVGPPARNSAKPIDERNPYRSWD